MKPWSERICSYREDPMIDEQRRRKKPLGVIVVTAAVTAVIVGLLAWWWFARLAPIRWAVGNGSESEAISSGNSSETFSITGDTTVLISPGVSARLDLTVTNPHNQRLTVRGLTVTLPTVTAPNAHAAHPCTIADFQIVQLPRSVVITVPAKTTKSLSALGVAANRWPRLTMIDSAANQDGCKGATLTLAYTATGSVSK